jgi:hypothetical protein
MAFSNALLRFCTKAMYRRVATLSIWPMQGSGPVAVPRLLAGMRNLSADKIA